MINIPFILVRIDSEKHDDSTLSRPSPPHEGRARLTMRFQTERRKFRLDEQALLNMRVCLHDDLSRGGDMAQRHFGSRQPFRLKAATLAQAIFVQTFPCLCWFVDWFACVRHGPCFSNHAASSQRPPRSSPCSRSRADLVGCWTRKAFIQRFAKLAMAQLLLGPCCTSRVAIFSHRDCVDDGVDAICPFCRVDLRDLLEVDPEIQCPVCQGLADPQGCGPDAVHLFPCCPRSLFHLSCLASLTPLDGRVWCPACPEDVRSGVDADWFERQCTSMVWSFPQILDVEFAQFVWRA